jgi:hypothetical protein
MTSTAVFLAREGQQLGPYTSEDLARMAASGQILESDHAWYEGMADWQNAAVVLRALGIAPTPATVSAATATADDATVAGGQPLFFTASTLKLVLMSVLTLGLYELYWFYRNWVLIKARTGQDLMPFWRAFFAPIWSYYCFKHIETTAAENNAPAPPSAGLLACGYFILQALWRLPDPYWLISALSFVPIAMANTTAIAINRKLAKDAPENDKFSGWNWACMVAGGLVLVLAVVGMLLPDAA